MNILGIHDGENASAALIRDGEVRGFSYEVRHRKVAEYAGFPHRTVKFLLVESGLEARDIDVIAFAGRAVKAPRTRRDYLKAFTHDSGIGDVARTALSYVIPGAFRTELRQRDRVEALARHELDPGRAVFVDAHLAAAMLAHLSGRSMTQRSLILCAGINADRLGASVHVAHNGRIERIASIHEEDSIHSLLENVTFLLGMSPRRDEHLLMDLGAQAQGPQVESAHKRFSLLFHFDELLPLNWQRASNLPAEMGKCQEFLRSHFRRRRFDHIAGGWYRFLCQFTNEWIGRCAHKTEIRDIVVCGDLFELNELMAGASRNRDVVGLSSSAAPSHAGTAMGAALLIARDREVDGAKALKPLHSPYVGPNVPDSVCDAAVRKLRDEPGVTVERSEFLARRVAELLAAGAVLARVAGREDARLCGLGNRSLMARADHAPAREKMREVVNPDSFWATQPIYWQSERMRNNFREADTLPEAFCGEVALTPRNASPWYGFHEGQKVPVHAISRTANPEFWEILDAFHAQLGRTPMLAGAWRDDSGEMVKTISQAATLWRMQGLSGVILGPWLVYRSDLGVGSGRLRGVSARV